MGRRQTRTNNRAGHGSSRGRNAGGRNPNGKRMDSRISVKENGRMKRWETAEDIPMDEEDEFFAARDKILLDGSARARARAGPAPDDEDEFDEDDEVFGLDGVGASSSEGEYDDDAMEEDQDASRGPRSKAKTKPGKQSTAQPEDSDASTDSEVELSNWGKSRSAYYADNSRVMDEDDEEARKMEEQEARRLQLKMISEIGEDDWGYNDVHDVEDTMIPLSAIPAVPALPTDKASLMRHMEKYDPLSLALARDWEDIAYQVIETSAAVKQVEQESPDDPALGLMHLHHQTLLSYATTLAFYLHLQSTPTTNDGPSNSPDISALTPSEAKRLRTEVIARLLTLKQSLATLEDLGFAADEDEDFDESDEDMLTDEEEEGKDKPEEDVSPYGLKHGEEVSPASGGTPRLQNLEESWQQDKLAGWMDSTLSTKGEKSKKKKKKPGLDLGQLEEGELEALMQDALDLVDPSTETSPPKKKKKVGPSETSETNEKKKKGGAPKPAFDLVEPEFTATKSKGKVKQDPTATADVDIEALGDPTQLSHTDASDKAGRRKSLRFHTSKIESTSNRRSTARSGMGGDDDLPYRERRKEQRRRGLGEGGDDLEMEGAEDGGADMDTDTASVGKRNRDTSEQIDDGSEGEDGYYELVRTAKKQRKEQKKTEYEAMRAAERVDPDEESSEGPRSLTRAILKNKGTMANRSPKNKAARNPRVKKKMQYAKAQKRLRSRQAVFKGGAEVAAAREGKYEGEKSGISGRVVKSIKL